MTTHPMEHDEVDVRESSEAGFSLVELMVVVFIMGLLATLIVVNVAPVGDQSRVTKAQGDISTIEQALEQYSLDMFSYPDPSAGLSALETAPAGIDAARYRPGGYIKRLRDDPWGNPYQYVRPAQRSDGQYDIYSSGPDGEPGNDDDIGNWDS